MAFASLFALFGVVLGLSPNGLVVFLLSVSGFIIGVLLVLQAGVMTESLVTLVTSFVGAGLILGGVFLMGSGVALGDLSSKGVILSVAERVSDSFWWVLVWIASAIIMRSVQLKALYLELFPEHLGYSVNTSKK